MPTGRSVMRKWSSVMLISVALIISTQGPAVVQTVSEGTRLFDEAVALERTGRDGKDLDTALANYQRALQLFEAAGLNREAALAARHAAGIIGRRGRYAEAAEYYEKALSLMRVSGDARNEPRVLNEFGSLYLDWGQHGKAIERFEEALRVATREGDVAARSSALVHLGSLNRDRGH
jgi:tetratricopeptide (TPR) repeat protein